METWSSRIFASEHPELGTAWIFELGRPGVTFDLFSRNLTERLGTSDAKFAGGLESFCLDESAVAAERATMAVSLLMGGQLVFSLCIENIGRNIPRQSTWRMRT